MKTDTATISRSEAAFMLRSYLGPIRNWDFFLADNVRARQSIAGLTLAPCCKKQDRFAFRPMYALGAVKSFIRAVLATVPEAGPAPITPIVLSIDGSMGWKAQKFSREGKAVKHCKIIYHRAKPHQAQHVFH